MSQKNDFLFETVLSNLIQCVTKAYSGSDHSHDISPKRPLPIYDASTFCYAMLGDTTKIIRIPNNLNDQILYRIGTATEVFKLTSYFATAAIDLSMLDLNELKTFDPNNHQFTLRVMLFLYTFDKRLEFKGFANG